MAVVQRTITLPQLQRELARYKSLPASINFGRPAKATEVYLQAAVKRRFHEGKDPEGQPWRPLSSKTRRRKRDRRAKGGSGPKPLRDTGRLRGSPSARSELSPGRAKVMQSTVVFYAPHQHYGTRTIPARPFLGVTDRDLSRLHQIAVDDVMRQLAKMGLRRG